MYGRTYWLDHVEDQHGTVIQQGTPMDQAHFNNEEEGISDVHIAAKIILLKALQTAREADGEAYEVTLTNNQKYPFNSTMDTPTTVALNKSKVSKNYAVDVYVKAYTGGEVGEVHISDKLTNGFKVAFDGNATSVTLILVVRGGM